LTGTIRDAERRTASPSVEPPPWPPKHAKHPHLSREHPFNSMTPEAAAPVFLN
jgi:hypothetical protein